MALRLGGGWPLALVVTCVWLLAGCTGQVKAGIGPYLKSITFNDQIPWSWDGQANCLEPPPFLRTGEEVDTAISGSLNNIATILETFGLPAAKLVRSGLEYYFEEGGWSLWPALGCLHTMANFWGTHDRLFPFVRAVPTDPTKSEAPYKLVCETVTGTLLAPESKKEYEQLPAYGRTFVQMLKMIVGQAVEVNYKVDTAGGCQPSTSEANYLYKLEDSDKPFDHRINRLYMNRTVNSGPLEEMDTYMVAATHRYMDKERKLARHILAGVSMSPEGNVKDCSIEFLVSYNDAYYTKAIADYINHYFGLNGLINKDNQTINSTETFLNECLEKAQMCDNFGWPTGEE